ncbi:MAG: hypothetical protein M1830_010654 [Pleopsidium flavum]|nr:MAG: hypothetical protein M1830_010654 [Pleopsidium flavum]
MYERRRRKSLTIFRPSLSSLTPINDEKDVPEASPIMLKKRRRPATFFTSSASSSPTTPSSPDLDRIASINGDRPASPKYRPRTLQKPGRPSSIFGSFRSLHSLNDDEEKLTHTRSIASSIEEGDISGMNNIAGRTVRQHGEVQTTGGMFRKRSQYLVLTDTHLVRFKSQGRASETFPSIPASFGRSNTMRHSSMASISSLQDLQSTSSSESCQGIPLHQIIAVYKLDDGKPYFSIEIAHMDEETNLVSSMTMQLSDPRESDLWLSSIKYAAADARLVDPVPFGQRSVEYVARALEQERDYDPNHFRMFRVVQRASNRSTGRSSSDDLAKLTSTICYLVIGVHKVHIIPLQKPAMRASNVSLMDLNNGSYGLTTLTTLSIQEFDDAFQLTFRIPLRRPTAIHLASSSAPEIALWIRHAIEYLRPEWLEQPIKFNVPRGLEDDIPPLPPNLEDHRCFDRTLVAYCAGYEVDTSNIRYAINYNCEDAPSFQLLPPTNPRRPKYSILELLAVFRALRFNESFISISFHRIGLDILHGLCDHHGSEHVPWSSRSGISLNTPEQEKLCLLVLELQALALKSKRLRRLDLSYCLERKPEDNPDNRDSGCCIAEAVFPLCKRQLTNVDWVVLNGILLADADLDYLIAAAVEKSCHFRALEVSRCGLTDRTMYLILQALEAQENTLEAIDISGNLARLDPSSFQNQIGQFGFIRKINLSRVHRTSGPEPLIAPETLMTWKLEELFLSETPMNEQTVDSVSAYLASSQSDTLRELRLDQCGLTGQDVAVFMHSMTRVPGQGRELHLFVSENHLEKDHDMLVDAVQRCMTPTHLTMKMVEYTRESHFREFVQALRKNTTLKYLDISKASLPYDASDETCEALQCMFAENKTLEVLDISGEHAHLEVARFGIGLNYALTGLKKNTALKVLRIEYQKLGLQGASTVASVLEKNTCLQEIYCENNDINLQGFTVLVNGLQQNHTLLHLPSMDRDRADSLQTVQREIENIRNDSSAHHHTSATSLTAKQSVRRTLGAAMGGSKSSTRPPVNTALTAYTEQDVLAAVGSLNERWDREARRLEGYLIRNYNLAHGVFPDGEGGKREGDNDDERPATAESLGTMLRRARLDGTPTLEREVRLGDDVVELGTDSEYGHDNDEQEDADEKRMNEKVFELGVDGAVYCELE